MTDFFTRLAQRTLGMAPVAQPIINPIFAPGTLIDNIQYPVQSKEPEGIMDNNQVTLSRSAQPAFSKPDLMVETRFPDMRTGQDRNGIPKPASKSANLDNLPDKKRLEENTPNSFESDGPFEDKIISEHIKKNIPEPALSFNTRKDVSEIRINLNKSGTAQQSTPAALQVQPTERSILRPYVPEKIRSHNMVKPTSSPPAPAIQVTIGRIEVRAIMPPVTPPQRSHTPGPTLSLDDYLKQRNGGQR